MKEINENMIKLGVFKMHKILAGTTLALERKVLASWRFDSKSVSNVHPMNAIKHIK